MKKKSDLRQIYEQIYERSINDRTWQRIRNDYLNIPDEYFGTEDDFKAAKGLAFLRKIRPMGKVRRQQAIRFGEAVDKFNYGGFGRDIAAAIAHSFSPAPDRSTLWRWGLRMEKYHTKEEVIFILGKLLGSDRYQLRADLSRMIPAQNVAA